MSSTATMLEKNPKLRRLAGFTVDKEKPLPVYYAPLHCIAAGMTREAGKTTLIEGIVSRWPGKRVIVFVTKQGEGQFLLKEKLGYVDIHPFYMERADWQFVKSIFELAIGPHMNSVEAQIMAVSEGAKTLEDVAVNAAVRLEKMGKKEGWVRDAFYRIHKYLEAIIPQINEADFSDVLDPIVGVNIMDLTMLSRELQSLVVAAVADRVMGELTHKGRRIKVMNDVVLVIPEAWEILPKKEDSPARQAVERFVKKGGALGNFLILDTQDLTTIHTPILKQISNVFLGKQQEVNEVKRTLNNLPMSDYKPKAAEVQKLQLGQFFAIIEGVTYKIFALPAWMNDHLQLAQECARDPTRVREAAKELGLWALMNKKARERQEGASAQGPAASVRDVNPPGLGSEAAEVRAKMDKIAEQVNKANERRAFSAPVVEEEKVEEKPTKGMDSLDDIEMKGPEDVGATQTTAATAAEVTVVRQRAAKVTVTTERTAILTFDEKSVIGKVILGMRGRLPWQDKVPFLTKWTRTPALIQLFAENDLAPPTKDSLPPALKTLVEPPLCMLIFRTDGHGHNEWRANEEEMDNVEIKEKRTGRTI